MSVHEIRPQCNEELSDTTEDKMDYGPYIEKDQQPHIKEMVFEDACFTLGRCFIVLISIVAYSLWPIFRM